MENAGTFTGRSALRALIIDDEPASREVLANMLTTYCPQIHLVGSAATVQEGLQMIGNEKPDLLFLDVEMKGETGFDLLRNLKDIRFDIIFTTAHEKYAIQAIRFSAMDYLMKPILADELKQSVRRVLEKGDAKEAPRHLDALIYNINYSNADKRLALPTANGFEFIAISDVVRCESSDNYTYFYLKDKSRIVVSKTLLEFERLLTNYYFFRVHQSHLVNLRMIAGYQKGEGGYLTMSDGSEVEVSRRKKADLLKALSEFALIA